MYKRLVRDASVYSISSVLARGFSLITVPIFTRILSPTDYGALDLLSYFSVLIPLVSGAALDQAVARFYLSSDDEIEKKRIASTVLFYTIFILLIFLPVARPAASFMANTWLDGQVTDQTVLLVFAFTWTQSVFNIVCNQLKYTFLSKKFAICNIGNIIVSTALSFSFVVFLKLGVFGVFLGQTLGQMLFVVLSFYYARQSYALVFHWHTLRRMLRYSLPLVPGAVAFYAMQYVDRYALNELRGLEDVGIYGIGARLASLVNLFLMGFHSAWNPTVMKHYKDKDGPNRFKMVFSYFLFVTLGILLGLSLFSKEILLLFTTPTFSQGYVVVPLLVLAAILASIGGYFTYGIQIAQKSSYRLILNVSVLFFNIILNVLLIPRMGVIGAALSTMLSFLILAIMGIIISQRLYFVPYEWRNIWAAALLAAAVSNLVIFFDVDVNVYFGLAKAGLFIGMIYITSYVLGTPVNKNILKYVSGK